MPRAAHHLSEVGRALRRWRDLRGMSQLDLALAALTSARHLSFIETGRAQPSRQMVLRLAEALDVPLRDRNALLIAAGYAPAYAERPLQDAAMSQVRRALDFILAKHEPYPAVVIKSNWDLVMANAAAGRLLGLFGLAHDPGAGPPNLLRAFFDPEGMRPLVRNWPAAARDLVLRTRHELNARPDPAVERILEEVLAYPGVPKDWRRPDLGGDALPILTVDFAADGIELTLFTTITTFGTPQDVTLQELRIETSFPADAASEQVLRALADEDRARG